MSELIIISLRKTAEEARRNCEAQMPHDVQLTHMKEKLEHLVSWVHRQRASENSGDVQYDYGYRAAVEFVGETLGLGSRDPREVFKNVQGPFICRIPHCNVKGPHDHEDVTNIHSPKNAFTVTTADVSEETHEWVAKEVAQHWMDRALTAEADLKDAGSALSQAEAAARAYQDDLRDARAEARYR